MKLKRTILGPVLVALFAFVSGGWLLQRGASAARGGADQRVLLEVLDWLEREYVDEDKVEDVYQMAVEGLLQELGDPNTTLLTPPDYERLRSETRAEYGGLGIQIAERDGWITILAPLPGTPAERAGLLAGDRIIEVEGQSTQGWSDSDAVEMIRGPRGSPVKIKILRPGVEEPIEYEIVREEIHIRSIRTSYMIEPGIGYARLDVFSEVATNELRAAIGALREQGMRGLILDLRGNPGGLLDQGVSVSDLFLPQGEQIVETRGRDPRQNVVFRASRPEEFPGLPIVVLVDQFSASASEIVAGALQDHDRALVVGTPTFGKGSVQTLIALSGGNYLKMTTGKWYTPAGRSIQKDSSGDTALALAADGMPLGGDGTPVAEIDTAGREAYRTRSGRVVYGGGGIVPDVIVRPDTLTVAEREFFDAASRSGNKYWNVIYRYALEYVRSHPNLQPDFQVTPEMQQQLFNMLAEEGVEVTWEQMQASQRLVQQHVGAEIALAKWGPEARAQRANRDDNVVRAAVDLLRNASDTQSLFGMAQARAQR